MNMDQQDSSALTEPVKQEGDGTAPAEGPGREDETAAPAEEPGREDGTAAPAEGSRRKDETAAPAEGSVREDGTAAPAEGSGRDDETAAPAGEDGGKKDGAAPVSPESGDGSGAARQSRETGRRRKKTRKKKPQSISRQLSLVFISLLCAVMLAMVLANSFFLERFYERRLENSLATAFRLADQHVTAEDGADGAYFEENFSNITEKNNLSVLITNSDAISDGGYFYYGGGGERGLEIMFGRLKGYLWGADKNGDVLKQTEDYTIQKRMDERLDAEYLELWGTLPSSGYSVLMRIPVEGIRTSAKISSEFIIYIVILAVIAGILLIQWLSSRITKPLRELTDLSERMANLDFNAKYTSGGTNEIGQLGDHFNQMSETLEKTISELKTANNELQANLDEKNRIDEQRREFLSNVSHELKTPLALIQGYAEGLQDCVNDDPESRDYYCEVIIDEAGKMNTLVRKLLALNQLESGFDKVEMVRFDLADLIRGKASSTQLLADQKGAKIEISCPQEVHVWGDEFKVEEVLTNYLSNAINHVEGENRIRIVTEEDRARHKVVTTVFNTGSHIPEEDLDQVWDKFFKVDKARTRAYGGSGVGLSIVKAIMESFHQKYGVRNVPGGVEFWFELESGDGELVDEEMADEDEYRARKGVPSAGEQAPQSYASRVFSRTEGSAEKEQQRLKEREIREKIAAEKARRKQDEVVDAAWVPLEQEEKGQDGPQDPDRIGQQQDEGNEPGRDGR